jgi:hypothetical protein
VTPVRSVGPGSSDHLPGEFRSRVHPVDEDESRRVSHSGQSSSPPGSSTDASPSPARGCSSEAASGGARSPANGAPANGGQPVRPITSEDEANELDAEAP